MRTTYTLLKYTRLANVRLCRWADHVDLHIWIIGGLGQPSEEPSILQMAEMTVHLRLVAGMRTMSVDSINSERSTKPSVKTGKAVFSMRTMAGTLVEPAIF